MKCKYIFCFLVFVAACVDDPQDIPPSIKTDPVFFAEIAVNQQTQKFTAGENGYAMKTEHFVDGEGITHYIATLSSETCQPAPCPSLEIEFYDHQVISHSESGVDYTFIDGVKTYYNLEEDGALNITFFLAQGLGPNVSFWTSSSDSMPLTSNEIHLTAKPDEFIDLCINRVNTDCSGSSLLCFHTIASTPFIGFLKANHEFEGYYRVEMEVQGRSPYTYSWMNGATTPFILVPAQEGEEFTVGVTVTDSTNSSIEIEQVLHIQDGVALMCGGSPQFVYSLADAPFSQFSSAVIRYTDAAGHSYSTEYGVQPGNTLFEILNVTDYTDSPEGFPTKQLEIAFNAILYSEDGTSSLNISSTHSVVAVSYED